MDGISGNIDLVMRLMSASAERARVIAGNVANENTPGYRRQVVRFEELLGDEADLGPGIERFNAEDGAEIGLRLGAAALAHLRFGEAQARQRHPGPSSSAR